MPGFCDEFWGAGRAKRAQIPVELRCEPRDPQGPFQLDEDLGVVAHPPWHSEVGLSHLR